MRSRVVWTVLIGVMLVCLPTFISAQDDNTDGRVTEPTSPGKADYINKLPLDLFTEKLTLRDGNLTIFFPDGWLNEGDEDLVVFASSRRVLRMTDYPPTLDDEDEFLVLIYSLPDIWSERDMDDLRRNYRREVYDDELEVTYDPIEEITIDGRKGLILIGHGAASDAIAIFIALDEENYVVVTFFTAPDLIETYLPYAKAFATLMEYSNCEGGCL